MSKKKNRKFKKSHSSQPIPTPAISVKTISATERSTEPTVTPISVPTAIETNEIAILNEKYQYVRRDVKKLLLTILLLGVLFVGFYILGQKTSILTQFADWIHKVGNFAI